jgi:hypothetical protein
MRRTTRRSAVAVAAAAVAALASCGSSLRPPACPSSAVATLNFTGTLEQGTNCPAVLNALNSYAPDGGISFTATVAYGTSSDAYLCVQKNEATPITGQRTGDHLTLDGGAVAATLDGCGCPLTVTETLVGDVLRGDGGAVVGFAGELSDTIAPAEGATGCELDGGATDGGVTCGATCTASWQVTATP